MASRYPMFILHICNRDMFVIWTSDLPTNEKHCGLILSAFGSSPLCSYRDYSPRAPESRKAFRQVRWFVLWPGFMSELLKEEKRMRIETGGLMLIENRPISISVTPLVPSPFHPLVRRPFSRAQSYFLDLQRICLH